MKILCCSIVWSLAVWVISAKCIASEARSASTSYAQKKIENEAKPSGAQRMKQLQQNLDTYDQTN